MRSILFALLFVGMAAGGYFAATYWQSGQELAVLNEGEACDLSEGPCEHLLPEGGSLSLQISPRPIPLMQTVMVHVKVSGADVLPLQLDITGLNMEMGVNRVVLKPGAGGTWAGETIIPICSQRRMHWRAALKLDIDGRHYQLADEFYTVRP